MGIGRMANTKLSPRNAQFIQEIQNHWWPYEISQSAVIDLMVTIVRKLSKRANLNSALNMLDHMFVRLRLASGELVIVPHRWWEGFLEAKPIPPRIPQYTQAKIAIAAQKAVANAGRRLLTEKTSLDSACDRPKRDA